MDKFVIKKTTQSESSTEIESIREQVKTGTSTKLKYKHYTDEERYKIGKYAAENGNSWAVRKFDVGESTVRLFKKKYLQSLRSRPATEEEFQSLPAKKRGRPTLLGEVDVKVQNYLRDLQQSGGIVNRNIAIAVGTAFLKRYKPGLVGEIQLGRKWAESLMTRMKFVKRKGTKTARKLPQDFPTLKANFLKQIHDVKEEFEVPNDMIINLDETGAKFVPVSEWTMATKGSKQVSITNLDDKREMTILVTINAAGQLLPTTMIYGGKTHKCLPAVSFPQEWFISHTENHWCNSQLMCLYIDQILVPYAEKKRAEHGSPDLPLIVIMDVYAAHRTNEVKEKLAGNNFKCIYVPASCTGNSLLIVHPVPVTADIFCHSLTCTFTASNY